METCYYALELIVRKVMGPGMTNNPATDLVVSLTNPQTGQVWKPKGRITRFDEPVKTRLEKDDVGREFVEHLTGEHGDKISYKFLHTDFEDFHVPLWRVRDLLVAHKFDEARIALAALDIPEGHPQYKELEDLRNLPTVKVVSVPSKPNQAWLAAAPVNTLTGQPAPAYRRHSYGNGGVY